MKSLYDTDGVVIRFSVFKPKRRYEVFVSKVSVLASLSCQVARWWIRGLPRGRSRGFVFQPRTPQEFASVHRVLCKPKQKQNSSSVQKAPMPDYSMRFVFSHCSLSSNPANVSASSSTHDSKIIRTQFQCRVSFCTSSDNVDRVETPQILAAPAPFTLPPPPPSPPPVSLNLGSEQLSQAEWSPAAALTLSESLLSMPLPAPQSAQPPTVASVFAFAATPPSVPVRSIHEYVEY